VCCTSARCCVGLSNKPENEKKPPGACTRFTKARHSPGDQALMRAPQPTVLREAGPFDGPGNNGPDLLGRWGAGTEIGTALLWDRAAYLTTICVWRTSQLRYSRTKGALPRRLQSFPRPPAGARLRDSVSFDRGAGSRIPEDQARLPSRRKGHQLTNPRADRRCCKRAHPAAAQVRARAGAAAWLAERGSNAGVGRKDQPVAREDCGERDLDRRRAKPILGAALWAAAEHRKIQTRSGQS
jgi:hypothetical protein